MEINNSLQLEYDNEIFIVSIRVYGFERYMVSVRWYNLYIVYETTDLLWEKFLGHLISCNGIHSWPLTSCDIYHVILPLEIFLNFVFVNKPKSILEFKYEEDSMCY